MKPLLATLRTRLLTSAGAAAAWGSRSESIVLVVNMTWVLPFHSESGRKMEFVKFLTYDLRTIHFGLPFGISRSIADEAAKLRAGSFTATWTKYSNGQI